MTPRRLAVLSWVVPIFAAMFLLVGRQLDETVKWPEPVGEPAPCYGTEDGETICPEDPPLPPPSTARQVATFLAHDTTRTVVLGLCGITTLFCSVRAIQRTRKTRRDDAEDRFTFRLAVSALAVSITVPLLMLLGLLLIVSTFTIRG